MTDIKDRRGEDPRFKKLFTEVGELKGQHQVLAAKLDVNTASTIRVEQNTAAIVEAWTALAGGLKVLGWLGIIAKYVAAIAGACGAVAAAWFAVRPKG